MIPFSLSQSVVGEIHGDGLVGLDVDTGDHRVVDVVVAVLIEEKSDNRAGSRQRAGEIAEMLESRGITATVRRSLGRDIDAACGQLRLNESFQRTIIVHNDNNA